MLNRINTLTANYCLPATWYRAMGVAVVACLVSPNSLPLIAQAPTSAPHQHSHADSPLPQAVTVVPETPEFKEATNELREHLKKMREVMVHFNTALPGPGDDELRKQWFDLQRASTPLYLRMLETAVAEYQLAPEKKPNLAKMLWDIMDRSCKVDRYEGMLQIGQSLLAGGFQNKELRGLTARTAFALNEYEVVRQEVSRLISEQLASPQLQGLYGEMDQMEQAWEEELAARQQDAQGEPLPRVVIHTTKGDIECELFENQAPETVGNFISLVESGFYNGLLFHRVIEQFVAQTGCPMGDGSGGPGYSIYGEAHKPGARRFFRGTLGMALAGEPDTGGSQFFFSFLPMSDLNGSFTAFGRVTANIDVLSNLVRVNPDSKKEEDKPTEMLDEIISIEVLYKRDHKYEPHKTN